MNAINIQIIGSVGVGKSTLAEKLRNFLKNEGIDLVVNNDYCDGENFSEKSLNDKWKAVVERNPRIYICTIQAKRDSI